MSPYQQITAAELAALEQQDQKLFLVDVRTTAEFSGKNVKGSQCWPLQDIEDGRGDVTAPEATPMYLLCASGKRSQMAAEVLSQKITNPLYVVSDSIAGCERAGFDINKDKGVISLERQVRIVAGSLVMLGVAIGALVNPMGYALSAFVGAGLTFSGVTDTCGMAILLAKMPWNRV